MNTQSMPSGANGAWGWTIGGEGGLGMRLFLSTFTNKVDKKGRVSVPATFRAALADLPCSGIVAYRSFTAPFCIEGCGIDFMLRLQESAQQQFDAFSPEANDIATLIFANAHQLACDPEGRVVLTEDLLAHAGIGEAATFVGKGGTFQIWEPQAFRAVEAEARARALRERPTVALRPRPPVPSGGGQ
jgi:MraZ protein